MRRLGWMAALAVLALGGCQSSVKSEPPTAPTRRVTTSPRPEPVLMPDLVGLPSAIAGRRFGEIEGAARLGLSSSWTRPITVRCGVRPRTVAWQSPAPGTPLTPNAVVHIRTAALNLKRFRGPCDPTHNLGPALGKDAELARQFYRFAADPSLDAPFAPEGVWVGIEHGPTAVTLPSAQLADLGAWRLEGGYAEQTGPFSALDTVARSGGYYRLHRGILPTCGFGNGQAPPALGGLRALTLSAPKDVTMACMEWWGVTLFLDHDDQIRGVALRLGSP